MRIARKKSADATVAYLDRVNRAIDFILSHLDEPLPLDTVARAAGFSPFYFHRIFRMLVGESVAEFVKRVRLERAVVLMTRKGWATRRQQSITDIALACGFASSSDFSRSFKQRYGVAPRSFDVEAFRLQRREEWQRTVEDPAQRNQLARLPRGANPDNFRVRLRTLPPCTVAYIRVQKSLQSNGVFDAATRLLAWAEQRGWADGQWLGYMWDDPEVVAHQHCRYDVGVVVPPFTPSDGIGRIEFPAMQVAEIEIRGDISLEMRALDWLFRTWLPSSGYVPAEQPAFEAWIGRPFAHGTERFELHVQLPVERA